MRVLFNTISIYIFCLVLINTSTLNLGNFIIGENQEEEEVENTERTETESEVIEYILLHSKSEEEEIDETDIQEGWETKSEADSQFIDLNIYIYTKLKVPLYIKHCCLRSDIV